MRRTIFAVFLATLILPVSVFAETVSLRSADHAGFSRLVIDMPESSNWVFGRANGVYEFRSAIADLTFNVSQVFVRMTKQRISRVLPVGNGRLQVFTGDEYHADVFELRDGRVVIDIKDGPPDPASGFESVLKSFADTLEPPLPELSQMVQAMPEPERDSFSTSLMGLDVEGLRQLGRAPPVTPLEHSDEEGRSDRLGDGQQDGSNVANATVEREAFIAQLEQNLIEQIGRASADGLLVPALPDVEEAQDIIENAQNITTQTDVEEDAAPDVALAYEESGSHIEIESAIDRAQQSSSRSRQSFAVDGGECIPSRRLDLASWGVPLDEEFMLPQLRAHLVDELDVPRQDGVLDLARYYLFLTYGAEAKSVLSFLPEDDTDVPLLLILAEIFENGSAENPGPLLDQQSCDTAAALWSVMATKSLTKGQDYNRSAIIAAFTVLPIHIRRTIGPELARRFADIGDTQTATQIKSVFTRTAPLEGTEVLLLDASIAESVEDFETSDDLVLEVVEKHAHETPETLIAFINEKRAQNYPVSEDIADIAETIAVEYRHHELEEALVEASIIARVLSGDLNKAFAQLKRAETANRLTDAVATDVRKYALEASIDTESDEAFLKAVFRNIDFMEAQMKDDNLLDGVAMRLFELGFDDAARRLGDAESLEVTDSEMSDYRALVSGDWSTLSQSENPNYATLADAVVSKPNVLTDDALAPNLKQLEMLLTDIKSKRESVLELLSK